MSLAVRAYSLNCAQ